MPYTAATENTRQNFLDAFWQLYCRQGGLKGVTVKEIVELAGYTRPTFYEYFTGVEDCLRQLEERLIPTEALLHLQLRVLTEDVEADALLEALDGLLAPAYPYMAILLDSAGDPGFEDLLISALSPCIKGWLTRGYTFPEEAESPIAEFLLAGLFKLFLSGYRGGCLSPLLQLGRWVARPRRALRHTA